MVQINDKMTRDLSQRIQALDQLPKQAYEYWVKITPKDSGNARRKTRLNNDTIVAAYPYAQRLDQGWSKQAEDGMSKPTEREIKKIADRIMRK